MKPEKLPKLTQSINASLSRRKIQQLEDSGSAKFQEVRKQAIANEQDAKLAEKMAEIERKVVVPPKKKNRSDSEQMQDVDYEGNPETVAK